MKCPGDRLPGLCAMRGCEECSAYMASIEPEGGIFAYTPDELLEPRKTQDLLADYRVWAAEHDPADAQHWADWLADALSAELAKTAKLASEEIGWLIERADFGRPMWWCGSIALHSGGLTDRDGSRWTTDSLRAVRFAREQDARIVAEQIVGYSAPWVVTEHMWIGPPSACVLSPFSSSGCLYGTRSCEVEH